MTLLEHVEAAAPHLKVFPLPSAVLFPGAVMPLHIFEPRYRAMVQDALAGDRIFALGGLEPGWEADYAGRPAMRPIACAGLIAWHEEQGEGRFNLLLQGIVRVRILEELPPRRAYREVKAQALADAAYQGPEDERLRQAILDLAGRVPASLGDGLLQMAARTSGGALADVVAAAVASDNKRREQLLAELDVGQRLREVLREVGELIGRLAPPGPPGTLN
jgi:Lon protease-like protein